METGTGTSGLSRIVCYTILVALALLCAGLWAVTVSAQPTSPAPLHYLPTRPPPPPKPPSKPPSKPKPQEPTPVVATPTPTPTPALSVDLTFEELGYNTFQMTGETTRLVDLYLPRHFVPHSDGSTLDLTISHVPSEPAKPCALLVELNGSLVAEIALSPENAAKTTYRIDLTDVPIVSGRNQLSISVDNGETCYVEGASISVTVYESSVFHLRYSLAQHPADLALYPAPFFEQSFEHDPVCFVLPHDPSAADLSAAGTVAAGLGKASDGQVPLVAALDTQIPEDVRDSHHLIVVGKQGTNRLLDQLSLPVRLDDPALSSEQGVVQTLISPWNPMRTILVITGQSDEGLSLASQALNQEGYLARMRGSAAIVQPVSSPKPAASRERVVEFTLADLGYGEEVFYGTRLHTLRYRFYMPLGFAFTEEPRFTLYLSHARTVSPVASPLNVYLNGVPIRSVLLDGRTASGRILEIILPSSLIHAGRNELRIDVEMNLEGEDRCLFLDSEHVWMAVYSHSYFYLPFTPQDLEPSLDLFLYPFNKRANLGGLLLILPDQPGQFDYDLMLQVAADLGAADRGDALALGVTTAGLVTPDDLQDRDLFLIGRPSVHTSIAELNDSLPQPFEPSSDLPRQRFDSVIYVQDPSWSVGLVEELAAPWDPERMILVLTGTTDEGVALASTVVFSQSAALAGNVAFVEESGEIQVLDTRLLPPEPIKPPPRPEQSPSLVFQLGEWWW